MMLSLDFQVASFSRLSNLVVNGCMWPFKGLHHGVVFTDLMISFWSSMPDNKPGSFGQKTTSLELFGSLLPPYPTCLDPASQLITSLIGQLLTGKLTICSHAAIASSKLVMSLWLW